jgi:hypothetical protein
VKRKDLMIGMELDSTEGLLSAVEAGLGVTFVSKWAVRNHLLSWNAKDRKSTQIEAVETLFDGISCWSRTNRDRGCLPDVLALSGNRNGTQKNSRDKYLLVDRLKIYLGYAPGAGKTYRMLEDSWSKSSHRSCGPTWTQ